MKKRLYYQIDITKDYNSCHTTGGGVYSHAYVLIFESEDISVVYSPDPVLECEFQSHQKREQDKTDAFMPDRRYIRHYNLTEQDELCAWYGGDYKSKSSRFWDAERQHKIAARVIGRLYRAYEAWREENPEQSTGDALKCLVTALRRLKALPVKYGEHGKYEVIN